MQNKDWKLFEPLKIKRMLLKNRLVMLPMSNELHDSRGEVTQRMIDFYRERAKGGVALITVELTLITDDHYASHMNISSDNYISGLNELAEAIQLAGAYASIQIGHRGCQHADVPPVDHMSEADIETILAAFGKAAERAKKAGFDAVEIHGGHGYMINQFLSGLSNHRNDRYGGTPENRIQFAIDVLHRVRKAVGGDFPISFRLSGSEFKAGGLDVEETCKIAKTLEKEGVDLISISAGNRESLEWIVQPMAQPRACLTFISDQVKKVLSVPLLIAGRINDPVLANSILEEGRADLIGMARGLTADPRLPDKTLHGKIDDIRKCIACNYCHGIRHVKKQPVRCAINASVGREREAVFAPSIKRKKVIVIGAGPAGLECSHVLSQRGHEVVLFEKDSRLGGKLWLAAAPPHKEEVHEFRKYLVRRMAQDPVKVNLNHSMEEAKVQKENPDAVVFATGAKPVIPVISGLDKNQFHVAENVFHQKIEGQHVAIIGGGQVGCELGERLMIEGKRVTIIEKLPDVCMDVEFLNRKLLLQRLTEMGLGIIAGAEIIGVEKKRIIYRDQTGSVDEITYDDLIVAAGYLPDEELINTMRYSLPEVYFIGDCKAPRGIYAAVMEGHNIGRSI